MIQKRTNQHILRGLFIVITISFLIISPNDKINRKKLDYSDDVQSSATDTIEQQWLDNTDFSTQDEWFYTKGGQGDNSTIDADISNGQANYKVLGNNDTFNLLSGKVNSSTWHGWDIYNNGDYLLPDVTEINETGCYVYHYLDESENGGAGQVHNFPSVHFRKNVSLLVDMSDYEIVSASLEVFFNASVEDTVDTPGDSPLPQEAIWDSATFYVEIADLNLSYAFRVAENKTSDLGQDSPSILTINDRELNYVSEYDLITALNLALEKDTSHSDFTIIMGIDIYCEDNAFPDYDEWNALIFNSFNLTFTYERKIEQFTSISWNQIGNQLTGVDIQLINATFNFNYKIDELWPTSSSPYSEIAIIINNNKLSETIRLSTAINTFQEAKQGGFDVTSLISKDVNISVSIQVLIANTFGLEKNITLSIDNVELNITYRQTFPDIEPDLQIFINGDNKTADPFVEVPIGAIVNVTIKYSDDLGVFIGGGLVQLAGVGILENLVENLTYQQYTFLINSTEKLSKGTNLLTITTQKINFQSKNIDFSIVVRKIETNIQMITGNDIININPGENVNLQVYLNDTDFNLPITGALVLYNWVFGQGILRDDNNDGIYGVNLNNIPTGSHIISISVFGSEDYVFQEYQITINVISGGSTDWTPLIIILSVGMVGLIGFFTLYQTYLKYPPTVRKSRKIRKKIRKGKKTKPVKDISSREDLIKTQLESNVETIQLEKKTEKGIKEK